MGEQRFPVVFPRTPALLDRPLRRMPAEWRLDAPIPGDQSKAQDARDKFLRWWTEHARWREREHGAWQPWHDLAPAPYYGAESAVSKR